MDVWLIVLIVVPPLVLAAMLGEILLTAPEGYEDEDGFHYGDESNWR